MSAANLARPDEELMPELVAISDRRWRVFWRNRLAIVSLLAYNYWLGLV